MSWLVPSVDAAGRGATGPRVMPGAISQALCHHRLADYVPAIARGFVSCSAFEIVLAARLLKK
jgi:hypothetical protein